MDLYYQKLRPLKHNISRKKHRESVETTFRDAGLKPIRTGSEAKNTAVGWNVDFDFLIEFKNEFLANSDDVLSGEPMRLFWVDNNTLVLPDEFYSKIKKVLNAGSENPPSVIYQPVSAIPGTVSLYSDYSYCDI